ncbi:MAG: hypothetical protein FWC68_03825, partial [Oscillospiraceae bacterium]|nr:hypothetical protein [Oscillospiraceae bacterium]
VTVLFFIAFLVGSFILASNQASSQVEMTRQVRDIYDPGDIDAIYSSYFTRDIIHIYNIQQLLAIGSRERLRAGNPADNNFQIFVEDAIYVLMNDLTLNAEQIAAWTNIREFNFTGIFDYNGRTITVP